MTELTDTHCHIQSAQSQASLKDQLRAKWQAVEQFDADEMIKEARQAGVTRLLCVGTNLEDSLLAVDFVQKRPGSWASIGLHPHDARKYNDDEAAKLQLQQLATRPKVVAVGECGLDYYYEHSPKRDQELMLRWHIEQLALKFDLPLIFHVREAFDDFWRIIDDYRGIRGVVHSFSASRQQLDKILDHGLYVGLNGIMTFTKNQEQLDAAKAVPLEKLLLETDAPFLTPVPFRGKICQPKHVLVVAEFLASLRGEPLATLASATSANAKALFGI